MPEQPCHQLTETLDKPRHRSEPQRGEETKPQASGRTRREREETVPLAGKGARQARLCPPHSRSALINSQTEAAGAQSWALSEPGVAQC